MTKAIVSVPTRGNMRHTGEHSQEEVSAKIAEAGGLYERYLELSGIARIPSELEARAWTERWQEADMRAVPAVGFVIDPSAC